MPKRGANEQNHHAVVILVKRTAGCTDNQANWLWANRQHYISRTKCMVILNVQ